MPSDVPELYRLAASTKGVFINPALTEPFGLTLLEAGATGLPIVATNDGGPRDIICQLSQRLAGRSARPRGDRTRAVACAHGTGKLGRMVRERHQGNSSSITPGATTASDILRDLRDILEHSESPVQLHHQSRRLPEFDRLIVTDLDNTLTGDDASLAEFVELIR